MKLVIEMTIPETNCSDDFIRLLDTYLAKMHWDEHTNPDPDFNQEFSMEDDVTLTATFSRTQP